MDALQREGDRTHRVYQNVVINIENTGAFLRWPLLIASLIATTASAQPVLRVSTMAWAGLAGEEKSAIQQRYIVETVDAESLGIIIDNQAADRSTPGSNAGSQLGAAIGGTAYLDRAFRNGNYSPGVQLGAIILGGVLGSALNTQPQQAFQFRYAVRTAGGNIVYHDSFSSDPFRHPTGVCVLLPTVSIAPEQNLCTQTTSSLKAEHIGARSLHRAPVPISVPVDPTPEPVSASAGANVDHKRAPSISTEISCRVGLTAPVRTSPAKCSAVNGVILND